MLKPTTISIALDKASLSEPGQLLDSLIRKIKEYNRQVEKSNKLLREQEVLKKKLNVSVVKGKTIGLVQKDK